MIEPTFSSWDPSLLITPAGEKGETDGRDMIGIRETRLSPHLEFTCSGGMISTTISQPRNNPSNYSRKAQKVKHLSFTLARIPQPFDESPSCSDPTDLKPLPASLWMDSDELDQYGTNDDMDFVNNEEAQHMASKSHRDPVLRMQGQTHVSLDTSPSPPVKIIFHIRMAKTIT